jgi:XTP/dITP diphosphohydrolase
MKYTRKPFIVSDDGLYIKALNGFPGALLKHLCANLSDLQIVGLLRARNDRRARFVNIIVFGDPKTQTLRIFSTLTDGSIAKVPSGSRTVGFAIERIFIPRNMHKTIAQLNEIEWHAFWNAYQQRLHYNKLGTWLIRGMPND